MIPFMFPVACIIPSFYYPNISCEMSPQLCELHQHLPEGTSVFHKWQRRSLFGPALRERCSGREMKPGHTGRWKHVFQWYYPHRPSEEKMWNKPQRMDLNLNITFNRVVPLHGRASASLSSPKGHCHTKLTTATTFSPNTLWTLEETLETNLTAHVPDLETVASSLSTIALHI